jgi:mono/diheme cytochrome c family protein
MPVARGRRRRHDPGLRARLGTRFLLVASAAVVLVGLGSAALAATKPKPDLVRGKTLFRKHCGNCHRFAPAKTQGRVGPNLTYEHIDYKLAAWLIANGVGMMRGFQGELKPAEIRDIAAYLAQASG